MLESGNDDQHLARDVGALGACTIRPTAFNGHCFYVRKCVTGKQASTKDFWDRKIGHIHLPQNTAEYSLTVEVLAKGENVGRPCSREHAKKFKRARCLSDEAKVGDFLMCPDSDIGIKRSPMADYEFFIEESVPYAVVEADEARNG